VVAARSFTELSGECTLITPVKTECGERTKLMNRLNQLIQDHTFGTISENDYPELVTLLLKDRVSKIKELIGQRDFARFYGEQLMTVKAENALLKINKNMGIS